MHCFWINQFPITSDLRLPCNPPCCSTAADATNGLLLRHKKGTLHQFRQVHWVAIGPRRFVRTYDVGDGILVCAADALRMHIDSMGNTITLDFDESNDYERDLAPALAVALGMSICTLFRGDIPLHGAGVEIDDKFISIMAPSGTGKSTLLWALLDQGARFANDDVVPVCITNGQVMAMPSVSLHAKLSKQALEKRGWDPAHYQEWVPGTDEFWIPIAPEHRVQEPRPLAALFVLRPLLGPQQLSNAELLDHVHIRQIVGGAALSLLMENTQGLWAVYAQLDGKKLLAQYQAVVQSVPIYTIEYYRCLEILPQVIWKMRDTLLFGKPST